MKYSIILKLSLVLLIFTINDINAQIYSFGIKGGISSSGIIDENNYLDEIRTNNMIFGINFNHSINTFLYFEIELNYEQKGYAIEVNYTDVTGNPIESRKIFYNFDYITIPISLQFQTGKKLKAYTNIGFYPSFLNKATIFWSDFYYEDENIIFNDKTTDMSEDASNFIFGGLVGLGVKYQISNSFNINMGFRFNQDFISAINNAIGEDFKVYHNSFNLTFGINYCFNNDE